MNAETELSRDELAAEYVLGTLDGAEREAFEEGMADDAELRERVAQWEARLIPMSELTTPKEPPPEVWRGIERRLWPEQERRPWWQAVWDSLALWRGVGLAASAALLLAVVVLMQPVSGPLEAPAAVALIETPTGQAEWMLTAHAGEGELHLRALGHQHIGDNEQCRLYLADNGGYRAVAVMPEEGERSVTIDRELARQMLGERLVISIEPNASPFVTPTNPTPLSSRWVTF